MGTNQAEGSGLMAEGDNLVFTLNLNYILKNFRLITSFCAFATFHGVKAL